MHQYDFQEKDELILFLKIVLGKELNKFFPQHRSDDLRLFFCFYSSSMVRTQGETIMFTLKKAVFQNKLPSRGPAEATRAAWIRWQTWKLRRPNAILVKELKNRTEIGALSNIDSSLRPALCQPYHIVTCRKKAKNIVKCLDLV